MHQKKLLSWILRINRNIVECKGGNENLNKEDFEGINRNIVECKAS